MLTIAELKSMFPRSGQVVWIGLRPARRESLESVTEVMATTEQGLVGDRYKGRNTKRQVTLIQAEHLPVIAAFVGKTELDAQLLRRNIVVRGINLLALNGQCVRIGQALLEITGACHPCSRMEEVLGEGGYNAVRGHGGMTAQVLEPGVIHCGDEVRAELR